MNDTLDSVGRDPLGGFWNRPFGSNSAKKFWTVKGRDDNFHKFECGSMHKSNLQSATAYTHHTIWFRGQAPSIDFARSRYYNKKIRDLELSKKKVEVKK